MFKSAPAKFRELMARDALTTIPLVLDPLSAKLAEAAGFEALYLGGGTLGYVKTSTEAHLSLTQLAQAGIEIRAASALPLILDGQCGWGDPMHMHHTISMTEAAGFAAIEIEDQLMPKRAHHHVGIEHLIPVELMLEKIRVTVAARRDPDFVIIGRTNACRSAGLDEALRRAEAFKRAGADVILVLTKKPEELRAVAERIEGPLLHLGVVGSLSMPRAEFERLGFRFIVDATTPFYARHKALRLCYLALARGEVDPTAGADFSGETDRVHATIGLNHMLEIEKRTVER